MLHRSALQLVPALAVVGLVLTGCASAGDTLQVSSVGPGGQPPPKSEVTTVGYSLTDEEKELDCKKLTGRMQVRILQIRDFNTRQQTSATSHTLQQAATALFGGSTEGVAPSQRYAKDRAVLEAYNGQLAAKGCPTFDLESDLQPKDTKEMPRPVRPAPKPAE
jgi:hypothetical protein